METSDRTLASLKTPRLSQEDLEALLANHELQFKKEIARLLRDYRAKFDKWLHLLDNGFNLVLFGLGSKKALLQEFHTKTDLFQRDVVVVNGFFPSLTVKQILNAITVDVLDAPDTTFAGLPEHAEFICDTLSEDPESEPVYLVVHNIDGPMLRGEKAQSILATLAAHPKIHLICSIDHINAPLLWDQAKLSSFNFVWFDTTTFLPYTEETRNENSLMVKDSGALALNSLTHVFASLTPNVRAIYIMIIKNQLAAIEENGGSIGYSGIAFGDLYQKCREAFLSNTDITLRAQLTEFVDHKLINIRKGNDGMEYLTIPLNAGTLKEFLDDQQDN